MNKRIIFRLMTIAATYMCIGNNSFAKQLEGSTALNKGVYLEGSTTAPGYSCDWHAWMACCFYTPNPGPWPGSGVHIDFWDDWMPTGKLRIVFQSSWGATQVEFNYNTPLPSSIASQLGYATLKVATGIYPITVTPAYPNGYADVNFTP